MSTNRECELIEVEPGEWWYVLEDYNAPKSSWDWREHASAYGPFVSEDAAGWHLSHTHANPGGHSIKRYREGFKADKVLQRLIDDANRRT